MPEPTAEERLHALEQKWGVNAPMSVLWSDVLREIRAAESAARARAIEACAAVCQREAQATEDSARVLRDARCSPAAIFQEERALCLWALADMIRALKEKRNESHG